MAGRYSISLAGGAIPPFSTNPTITDQPLIGVPLTIGEFSYSGTPPFTFGYQWNLDGANIGGATSVSYTPVAGDFGKTLSCTVTLTNAAGSISATGTAPAVVGVVYSETFSGYADGDPWATIDTLYNRTSSAISAAIVADANSPYGKAMRVSVVSASNRFIYRADANTFGAANQAQMDRFQQKVLFKHIGTNSGRYHMKPLNVGLTAGLAGLSVYNGVARFQLSTEDVNSPSVGTVMDGALVSGNYYWCLIDLSGNTAKCKFWAFGAAEPTDWTTRTDANTLAVQAPAMATRYATSGAAQYDVLYWAAAWNADAPYWTGFAPPVAVSSDPQTFAAATSQTVITAMDSLVTLTLASAGSVGRYLGGAAFVTGLAGWPSVASVLPASALVATTAPATETGPTWRHGLEVVVNMTGRFPGNVGGGSGPPTQPYDGRTEDFGGNGPLTYDGALNFDPGKTGAALAISQACVLIKAVSKTDAEVNRIRNFLKARVPVFFIDHVPAADSLPPPIGAVPLISKFVKTDIDFGAVPNFTPTAGGPAASTLLAQHRWLKQYQMSERPRGDYYTSSMVEDSYASDSASDYATRILTACMDIDDTTKELLLIHTVIDAQNIVESLKAGARFNTPSGLGGILAGHKLPVVVAAILTGDSEITSWAQRTDWAAEDRQCFAVTQAQVDTYDYVADDLAMPEWTGNPVLDTSGLTRSLTASTYRRIFLRHHIGQAIAAMMIPGAKAMWNHAPFFDLADRYMQRTIYKDGASTNQWARTLSGSNAADTWHIAVWDAHRADGGMPAIWNWPA